MATGNETGHNSNRSLIKASSRICTIIAIIHFATWAACLVLGIAAVWLRLQRTQGWSETYFGASGIAIWASFPFLFCGILAIAIAKTGSRRLVSWFMLLSAIGWICSLVIFCYSVIAIVNEGSVEIYPRRLIIAAVTSFASFIEFLTTSKSLQICFHAIGFNLQFLNEGKLTKNRIRPATTGKEREPGLITVMALPPREAAELFLAMYRPQNNSNTATTLDGLVAGGEYPNQFFDFYHQLTDHRRYSSPDDRRKHKRKRHRRAVSRNESTDDSHPEDDKDESENEWSLTHMPHNSKTSGSDGSHNKGQIDESQHHSRSNRLATVPESRSKAAPEKDLLHSHHVKDSASVSKEETLAKSKNTEKKQ